MNKENIKKWLDALASGEFQQATKRLNAGDNQRCCLGVACDVYMRETGNGHWIDSAATRSDGNFGETECELDLINIPELVKVTRWYNIYLDLTTSYSSRELADKYATVDRVACIEHTFDVEVGQGL